MPEQSRVNHDDTPRGYVSITAALGPWAVVGEAARVEDHAHVTGFVLDDAVVSGHARVDGTLREQASIGGHAVIFSGAEMYGSAAAWDSARIAGRLTDNAIVAGDCDIPSFAEIGTNAVILNRRGYAGGVVSHETWDAYTCYTEKTGWYISVRFGCKARPLSCWKKDENVASHAYDISYAHKLYWIEVIEQVVELAGKAIVVPVAPPQLDALQRRKEDSWQA